MFGTTTTPSAGGGFTLGQAVVPTNSSGGGFSLGQPTASTASIGGGFSSGQPPTTAAAIAGGFTLGQPATSTATTGFTGLPSAPPSTLTGALNFGLGNTSSGLTLGAAAPVAANTAGFSFQTGGTSSAIQTSIAPPTLGLGGAAPVSAATPICLGLGGSQPPTATGSNIPGLKPDGKSAKETPLPQELFLTIDQFENYKSTEKAASEANVRQTAAPFHKLGEDTKKLRQHVLQLSNKHSQLQASTNKLKLRVMEDVENIKMARRTQETPMAQQGDNKAPDQYFIQLVRSFEHRMRYCRTKIEEVENCNRAANGHSGVSAEDMKEVLRREHETLKVLAAKVYTLHHMLIDKCHQLNTSPESRPDVLFKPRASSSTSTSERSALPSSVLRPFLGDGGSGLHNFQAGQQKVKALSLGAPPPTLPLAQSLQPSLLGSMNQTGIFNTGSNNTTLWGNTANNNFKFNNTNLTSGFTTPGFNNTFGSPVAHSTGSIGFVAPTATPTNQPTLFGSPATKPFGS